MMQKDVSGAESYQTLYKVIAEEVRFQSLFGHVLHIVHNMFVLNDIV